MDMPQMLTAHEAQQINKALQVLQIMSENPRMTQEKACQHIGISVPTYRKWISTQESALATFEAVRTEVERNEFATYLITKTAISNKLVADAMKNDVSITERIKALEFIDKKLDEFSNRYHTVDVEAEQELLSGPKQEPGRSLSINRISVDEDENETVIRVKNSPTIIDMTDKQ